MESVRIDKYLWAIRVFKTRSLAAAACDAGKVRLNGDTVKASKAVQLNAEYEIKTEARKWVIRITGIISNRVAYPEAIKQYIDLTPAEELQTDKPIASSFYTGKRLSKVGRPTKQQRRNLDEFMDGAE
ncbi:MAG: RNA-binding S4 domain-containing protein [Chitinophagaceae bacterium]